MFAGYTITAKVGDTDMQLKVASKKVALAIKEQLNKAGHEAKVVLIKEIL